jgi:hypothetical protein
LEEFKAEIRRSVTAIPLENIRNAIAAFPRRIRKVGDNQGKHCHNVGKNK